MISLHTSFSKRFFDESAWEQEARKAQLALDNLQQKTGAGNEFLGWLELPSEIDDQLLTELEGTASLLKDNSEYVVVIGIGGSYLGSRAVIEALSNSFGAYCSSPNKPKILFAGHQLSGDYLSELLEFLSNKKFSLVVISKSGTTTEPAIAFRLLKGLLEKQHGSDALSQRIVAITDSSKGALRRLADEKGFRSYIIPDDVGGRFSVLTPVGLLPIAISGFDIRELINGAREMQQYLLGNNEFAKNPAANYAIARNILYQQGFTNEILVNYHPKLSYMSEWWKQLYGESEGKEGKGIFPASVNFTTDLHSMGQYIQDGKRNLFETLLLIDRPQHSPIISKEKTDFDQLNYLAGQLVEDINKIAAQGTMLAHIDGGVPQLQIRLPELNAFYLGQLIYFFELACGISAYLLDVNPFDQPGVEAYKRNMFALLGKPGFEEEGARLKARL